MIWLPSITGCAAITALSENVTEPRVGTVMGVEKVNVVLAVGGVTVTDCPAPVRVIELNKAGSLTLTVTEAMVSATARSFRTVNVPAGTVEPGAATSDTDVLVTSAPNTAVGVGLGPEPPNFGVGVGVAVGAPVGVGVGTGTL